MPPTVRPPVPVSVDAIVALALVSVMGKLLPPLFTLMLPPEIV